MVSDKENEYYSEYDRLREECHSRWKDKEGRYHTEYKPSEEFNEIKQKYFDRELELAKEYEDTRAGILSDIGRNLPRYWD